MNIRCKFAAMLAIPVVALLALVVWGSASMRSMLADTKTIVDQLFMAMLTQDVQPLITKDIPQLQGIQEGMRLMLEADRDAHQAVIAEKMALGATSGEMAAVVQAHAENVQQLYDRMAKASASFDSKESQALMAQFLAAFKTWKEKSGGVLAKAQEPGKLAFAIKASNGGSAETSFNAMRGLIDELEKSQETRIKSLLGGVDRKRTEIQSKQERIVTTASQMIATLKRSMLLFAVLGAVAVVLSIAVASVMAGKISRPILEGARLLEAVALRGDLAESPKPADLRRRDELGAARPGHGGADPIAAGRGGSGRAHGGRRLGCGVGGALREGRAGQGHADDGRTGEPDVVVGERHGGPGELRGGADRQRRAEPHARGRRSRRPVWRSSPPP